MRAGQAVSAMRTVEFDASNWRDWSDLYAALLPALGAPDWHGRNLDALRDSMLAGSINDIEGPYLLRFTRLESASQAVREAIATLADMLELEGVNRGAGMIEIAVPTPL